MARQRLAGYRLAAGRDAEGALVVVAGFVLAETLAAGRHLRVDDLVGAPGAVGADAVRSMLAWLAAHARGLGCVSLQVESGVESGGGSRAGSSVEPGDGALDGLLADANANGNANADADADPARAHADGLLRDEGLSVAAVRFGRTLADVAPPSGIDPGPGLRDAPSAQEMLRRRFGIETDPDGGRGGSYDEDDDDEDDWDPSHEGGLDQEFRDD